MRLQRRQFLHLAASAAALSALSHGAQAQTYPTRPITMIVPFPAAGPADVLARILSEPMRLSLGQPVVTENVSGAAGSIAVGRVARATPDGYTLILGNLGTHVVNGAIYSLQYDLVRDFEPICLISSTASVLTASPKTPWSDWKGLLADAKARPGQISVGATLGSTSHFFPALIEKAAGIKFKYVSYEGLAPRMNAILGGHVDLTDANMTQKGKVEAGQLKFIAIATEKRNPEIPNVPTLKELGVNVVYDVNRGIMVPKGTPPEAIAKLEAGCAAAVKDPSFADSMKKQATDVRYLDRKAYGDWLKHNDELNKTLAKDLGLLKR